MCTLIGILAARQLSFSSSIRNVSPGMSGEAIIDNRAIILCFSERRCSPKDSAEHDPAEARRLGELEDVHRAILGELKRK